MVANALRARLEPHLEPGETLLWSQPGPVLRLTLPLLIPLAFTSVWTAAAAGFTALVVWTLVRTGGAWTGLAISGAMTLAGLAFLAYVARGLAAGARTLYAVTDRAALIVEDVRPRAVRRFTQADIARRRRWGDRIAFRPDIADGNAFDSLTSFIGVRDIEAVTALLDAIAPAAPQAPAGAPGGRG